MKCYKTYALSFVPLRLLAVCLLFCFIMMTSGCKLSDAMIAQSYDSDRSMILFGHDFKYVTGSYLGEHNPEIVPEWLEKRQIIEKAQAKRKEDIDLPNGEAFLKVFGVAFSGWQTGGIAGIISLLTLLGGIITKRRHEKKVRDKVEEEGYIAEGKKILGVETAMKKKRKKRKA